MKPKTRRSEKEKSEFDMWPITQIRKAKTLDLCLYNLTSLRFINLKPNFPAIIFINFLLIFFVNFFCLNNPFEVN